MSTIPLADDPMVQFGVWYKEAEKCKAIEQANAMCLATIDPDGFPDGRMVLMKGFDARGFVFYTNLKSLKGRSLAQLPKAALIFHWDPLKTQIRIQGATDIVPDAEADAYWKTRPRISQIGAWASLQSEPLDSNRTFIKRLSEYALKFGVSAVPRPPHWSGYRLKPVKIEFWRARRGRLHERILYTRQGPSWNVARLYP
ncbi:MAG TPA: pyridoxamine 5'-phosphate oxidase [Elusimicrobiota bacterium]|nr:pyridoxamine 5'-phosphate oxidase [Elusimicrobiota bacterium]